MWRSDSGEISGLCCLLKENCSRVLKTISQNAAVENQNSCLTSSDSSYDPYKGINNLDIKQRLLPVIKVRYRSAQLGHVTSLHGSMPEWRITEKNGDLLVSVKKAWRCGEGKAEQGLEMSWEKLEAIDAVLQDIHLTPCFLVFFLLSTFHIYVYMYILMGSFMSAKCVCRMLCSNQWEKLSPDAGRVSGSECFRWCLPAQKKSASQLSKEAFW